MIKYFKKGIMNNAIRKALRSIYEKFEELKEQLEEILEYIEYAQE